MQFHNILNIQHFCQKFNLHNNILQWIAVGCMTIGAYIISISPTLAANSSLCFSLFLIGHVLWLWHGIIIKEKSMIYFNITLIPLDIYAMIIRL